MFDYIFYEIILIALSLICRYVAISFGIVGIISWAIFSTEYYKFGISGTHFTFDDLLVFLDGVVVELGEFFDFHLTLPVVSVFLIIAAVTALLAIFKLKITLKPILSYITAAAMLVFLVLMITLPSFSGGVYKVFGIDDTLAGNVLKNNDKFIRDGQISFFVQSISERINNIVKEPKGYSRESVEKLFDKKGSTFDASQEDAMPTVIFILDEAFSDMRNVLSGDLDEYYAEYDAVCRRDNVVLQNVVVPTFGSYTCRTEFELMFALPVASLNNAATPHTLFAPKTAPYSVAKRFSEFGYHTEYIHPFTGDSYSRNDIYSDFGFDECLFSEELQSEFDECDYKRDYVTNDALFSLLEKKLDSELKKTYQPSYYFVLTMENHQPYTRADGEFTSELDVFLNGCKSSFSAFRKFLDYLDGYENDVIVVFGGDHYPMFSQNDVIYGGVSENDRDKLFYKQYIIYENHGATHIMNYAYPECAISSFYLPSIIMDTCKISDEMSRFLLCQMKSSPVYTTVLWSDFHKNDALDVLTYDMVLGKSFYKNVLYKKEPAK